MGTAKLCACDRTRQCTLCTEIDFIDTVHEPFLTIVRSLCDVKDGLWLNPFRGIPRGPQISRFDVIYLDEDCRVLDFAVNFTQAEFEPIPEVAASALILPAHSLASFPIRKGDQLRICKDKHAVAGVRDSSYSTDIDETQFCTASVVNPVYPGPAKIDQQPVAKLQGATNLIEEEKPSLTLRLLRWIFPKPASSERRRSERLPEPGLIAYYWTGGSPNSYPLGNISGDGLYLVTNERWLPGTRILMTLQKDHAGTDRAEDICRVESEVVRWGEDGVGCEFVESGFVDLNNGTLIDGQKFDREALEHFLSRAGVSCSNDRQNRSGNQYGMRGQGS